MMKPGSLLHVFFGMCLNLIFVSVSTAQDLRFYKGVNDTHLGWEKPQRRDKIIDDMKQSGVRSIRVSLSPPYDQSMATLEHLSREGLSILLVVETAWPDLMARGATRRPGRGAIYPAVPLSQLNPEFFRKKFGALWREIEQRQIHLVAIELGNEINWAPFNGDLKLLPPRGKPPQGAPGSAALIDRGAYLKGLNRYVAALSIVKQLRDASALNRQTQIISAGLASMNPGFAAHIGAEYVDPDETLKLLKADGLDTVVDGYGLHSYPNINAKPQQRGRDLEVLLRPCSAGPHGHPCWLTEWGVAQPHLNCPSDESRRLPLVIEMEKRIATYAGQKRIAGAYYYDWGNKPEAYAVWRCGGLTASGRTLFAR